MVKTVLLPRSSLSFYHRNQTIVQLFVETSKQNTFKKKCSIWSYSCTISDEWKRNVRRGKTIWRYIYKYIYIHTHTHIYTSLDLRSKPLLILNILSFMLVSLSRRAQRITEYGFDIHFVAQHSLSFLTKICFAYINISKFLWRTLLC